MWSISNFHFPHPKKKNKKNLIIHIDTERLMRVYNIIAKRDLNSKKEKHKKEKLPRRRWAMKSQIQFQTEAAHKRNEIGRKTSWTVAEIEIQEREKEKKNWKREKKRRIERETEKVKGGRFRPKQSPFFIRSPKQMPVFYGASLSLLVNYNLNNKNPLSQLNLFPSFSFSSI